MTVRDFLRVMWEGKYLLLGSVVLALVAAVVYAGQRPDVYEATATVQFNAVDLGDDEAPATLTTVDTDPRLVAAPGVLNAVADAVDAGVDPRRLANQVSGEYDADAEAMAVTVTDGTPEGAVALANAVSSAYVKHLPRVVDDQITEIDERRDALRTQLVGVDQQVKDSPKDPLAGAERETIIKQYETLSASRSTLESIVTPAQVLTPATGSSAVVVGFPGYTIVLLGALAGLALGGGLALGRRALDTHVRERVDATAAAGVPVLAELYGVAKAVKSYRRTPVLPVSSRVASPFTESIRELRTALHVAMQDRPHAVVVVTAADPSAPRSFIAANLAASWAMSGRTTVAVAGDLRRPDLENLLPSPNGPEADPEGLRRTQVPHLRFLSLHEPSMDPADFLATDRVRTIVESARDAGDVLVIDAPPVLAAADATILGTYADCVVLVATVGGTDSNVLAQAADRLRINGVPLTGLALAGVKSDHRMDYASTYGDPVGQDAGRQGRPGEAAGPDATEPTTEPTDEPTTEPTDEPTTEPTEEEAAADRDALVPARGPSATDASSGTSESSARAEPARTSTRTSSSGGRRRRAAPRS